MDTIDGIDRRSGVISDCRFVLEEGQAVNGQERALPASRQWLPWSLECLMNEALMRTVIATAILTAIAIATASDICNDSTPHLLLAMVITADGYIWHGLPSGDDMTRRAGSGAVRTQAATGSRETIMPRCPRLHSGRGVSRPGAVPRWDGAVPGMRPAGYETVT